ncbi:hypothetical protein [Streptacidiphilus cavernicola]|uniref:Ricin B lectin domain-containing protein n=1 Tax=Streptacidiphilus cavernicola TaxID=3342716 RepID=A0ABV6VV07_9ACTN
MIKSRLVKMLLVGCTIPAAVVSLSSSSYAATGSVTWTNKWSGDILCTVQGTSGVTDCNLSNSQGAHWTDRQNSDGSWNEVDQWGRCLTTYWTTNVYVESCNSAANGTNNYERWDEISTATGWKLKNVATGYILDEKDTGGGAYHFYSNATDYGNSDSHQRFK